MFKTVKQMFGEERLRMDELVRVALETTLTHASVERRARAGVQIIGLDVKVQREVNPHLNGGKSNRYYYKGLVRLTVPSSRQLYPETITLRFRVEESWRTCFQRKDGASGGFTLKNLIFSFIGESEEYIVRSVYLTASPETGELRGSVEDKAAVEELEAALTAHGLSRFT